jgi:glycosidase
MRNLLILLGLIQIHLFAQEKPALRIEPPFWWTGFNHPELQIMVYGNQIANTTVHLSYPGVEFVSAERTGNPNYLFMNLVITPKAKPGTFTIRFKREKATVAEYTYELRKRKDPQGLYQGFDASEVIYLLMPDRFANGDTLNDNIPGMRETVDRSNPDGRHGGDIQGIISHLDYLKDLGISALWINPLLENDQQVYSYHGYSATDYYKVDPRFGSNEDYIRLSEEIHKRGMKLIMDMVFNHCGSYHWWMNDLPSPDWINQWPEFTRSTYRVGTVNDPYAAPTDSIKFVKGWFDKTLPDLNQHNPFLKNYLIQNSIWWIEYASLDGIRQDTHPYPFKDMMAEWGKRLSDEYPTLNIVGEVWLGNPVSVAYWQQDALNNDGYNSHLPAVFDFPLYDAMKVAFNESQGWSSGVTKLYDILAQDFVYPDPSNLVIFADNHDVNRYLDTQGDDIRKMKMAMAFLLTTRGIPQIYYGTEFLMTTGEDEGHGSIRKDVTGGWPGDERNAFTEAGRTQEENGMFTFLQNLLHWRQSQPVIHSGKLRHFIPEDGIYVYFRFNETDTVLVVMNNNMDSRVIKTGRFREFMGNSSSGLEITTGRQIEHLDELNIPAKTAYIIGLKP